MRFSTLSRSVRAAAPLALAVFVVTGLSAAAQQGPAPVEPPRSQDRVPADPAPPDVPGLKPAPPAVPELRPGLVPEADAGGALLEQRTAPGPETLDQLFERLKSAKRPELGRRVAREIEHRWLMSGSDTVDLLMVRALAAIKANEFPLALDLLDAIVVLKPDYVEGWNKRATVRYARKELGASVADVEMTLRLEPRHFGALYGLATLMKDLGRKKEALAAFRRIQELNPHMQNVEKEITQLSGELDGRDL